MKIKRALLIKVDYRTGHRAGDINPRDPSLPCCGQALDGDCCEIRLVEDDRDLSRYIGIPGVSILIGKDEINAAIDAHIPITYAVFDTFLLVEHMKQRGISLDIFRGKDMKQIAEEAEKLKLSGVKKTKPEKVM